MPRPVARALATLLVALAMAPAWAQGPDERERVIQMLQRMDERREAKSRQAAASLGLPEGSRIRKAIPYERAPERSFDLYLPPGAKNAPVIVWAAQSGWTGEEVKHLSAGEASAARQLAKGYAVMIVHTRLWPQADPVGQALDLARALAFAQARAEKLGLDPERIVLAGHAAGGHLAALIAADPHAAFELGARPWAATIVLDASVYDASDAMSRRPSSALERAFGDNPDFWLRASPARRLSPSGIPMLIVCSAPRPGACEDARGFAERARRARPRAELFPSGLSQRDLGTKLSLDRPLTDRLDAFLRSVGLP